MIKNRPYFPFILGNGVDSLLVDYSGSNHLFAGHHHFEQHQSVVCAWYKATHREKGPIYPIIQTGYNLAKDRQTYEIADFAQEFDPMRAMLITHIKASGFHFKLESFLTSDQVWVEHYTIDSLPKGNISFEFILSPPKIPFDAWSPPFKYNFRWDNQEKIVFCDYSFPKIDVKGKGALFTDYSQSEYYQYRKESRIVLTNIGPGFTFTKYLILLDNKDHCNYGEKLREKINKIRETGYIKVKERHEEEWQHYQNSCQITVPDKVIQYLYYTSLYLVKACQHPAAGLITTGNYPQLWDGASVNTWDSIFHHKALLSSNRIQEAKKLIEGYKKALPFARDCARKMGSRGAWYPWMMNWEGKCEYIRPGVQVHNNGTLVMQVWDYFLYTQDAKFLKECYSVIKEPVDFLIFHRVEEKTDTAVIKPGQGSDESIDRENDTAHLLTTIKALQALIKASKILGKSLSPHYSRIERKLRKGLKDNYAGNVLLPYKGAPRSSNLSYYLLNLPEGMPKESVEEAIKRSHGKWGLIGPPIYSNMLIWPWNEHKAAIALAYLKDKKAWKHFYKGSQHTSSLGLFPEKIRIDSFPIGYGYTTPHASFVMALNTLLIQAREDTPAINILPGIPQAWKKLQAKRLRIPPGILVSFKLSRGKLTMLMLENKTEENIVRNLEIPTCYLKGRAAQSMQGDVTIPAKGRWVWKR